MRKLGQKVKIQDKKEVKLEEVSEPVKNDSEPKVFLANTKGQYSLFAENKKQPMQHMAPAEEHNKVKAAVTGNVAVQE